MNVENDVKNVPEDQPIKLSFSSPIDTSSIKKAITLKVLGGTTVAFSVSYSGDFTLLTLTTTSVLQYLTDYTLTISSDLRGINRESFPGVEYQFTTLAGSMVIDSISLNGEALTSVPIQNVDPKSINISITFSRALDHI